MPGPLPAAHGVDEGPVRLDDLARPVRIGRALDAAVGEEDRLEVRVGHGVFAASPIRITSPAGSSVGRTAARRSTKRRTASWYRLPSRPALLPNSE
jgi:hypothetical protein